MNQYLHKLTFIAQLFGVLCLIVVLYLGQEFIIPLILAMLFSFFLTPVAQRLERYKLNRATSSILVTVISFSCIALLVWALISELVDITTNGSKYANSLIDKFLDIQSIVNQQFRSFGLSFRLSGSEIMSAGTITLAPHLLTMLFLIAIIAILTCLMMIYREDIRDRILALGGQQNVVLSTSLLDQSATRLSRYLALAAAINIAYAVLFGFILYFAGVPNPIVWASAVIVLRFLPHVGVFICAVLPSLLLFATTPGWEMPLALLLSAVSLDLFFTNIVDPVVYGPQMGVLKLPLFIATLFWTWLWGLPGFALATPITICLTVLGQVVPSLRILSIIFDAKNPLDPGQQFCQRLATGDISGAKNLWNDKNSDNSKTNLIAYKFDTYIQPCLNFIKSFKEQGHSDLGLESRVINGLTTLLRAENGELILPKGKRIAVIFRATDFNKLLAQTISTALMGSDYNVRSLPSNKIPKANGMNTWLFLNGIEGIVLISSKEKEDKFVRLIKARLQQIKIELPIVIYNSGIRPEMVNSYDNQQYIFPDRLVA